MSEINEKQRCRKLYSQIVSGYTPALFLGSQVYIKHFSDNEFSSFEEEYEILFKEAVEKGLEAEADKLAQIIELEHWSQEEEQQIIDAQASINLLHADMSQLTPADKWERSHMQGHIEELENVIAAHRKTRNELIGTTADAYAQRKNNERIILHSIYKDEKLTAPYFTDNEFDELTQDELVSAITLYNVNMEFFTEKWIKMIATMPSFLNSFFLCDDDPVRFYGKSIINLTIYQTDLFSKGKYYKSVLSESPQDGPDSSIYDKGMQEVVNWYDREYATAKAKAHADHQLAKQKARQSKGRGMGVR